MAGKLAATAKAWAPLVRQAALWFVGVVALALGVLAAWLALVELVPMAAKLWRPKGAAQAYAITGAALAIIAGRL